MYIHVHPYSQQFVYMYFAVALHLPPFHQFYVTVLHVLVHVHVYVQYVCVMYMYVHAHMQ